MDKGIFTFEQDYQELKNKLQELKTFAEEKHIDLSGAITQLEQQLAELNEHQYQVLTPWQKVQMARNLQRPTALDFIQGICDDFIELHGDRCYGDDPAIVGGIALFNGGPVTVIGEQKGKNTTQNLQRNFGMPMPKGYRKALRLAEQAEKFRRPVLCMIDTPGADPGIEAEEQGQGWAISHILLRLSELRVPVISLVIGEGGSGGALALAVADRVLILSYAIFSVISPESAASILWKDTQKAPEMAEQLKLTAPDLLKLGVVDEVIPEPLEGVQSNPEQVFHTVKERLVYHLDQLCQIDPTELVEQRYQRLRRIGVYQEQ